MRTKLSNVFRSSIVESQRLEHNRSAPTRTIVSAVLSLVCSNRKKPQFQCIHTHTHINRSMRNYRQQDVIRAVHGNLDATKKKSKTEDMHRTCEYSERVRRMRQHRIPTHRRYTCTHLRTHLCDSRPHISLRDRTQKRNRAKMRSLRGGPIENHVAKIRSLPTHGLTNRQLHFICMNGIGSSTHAEKSHSVRGGHVDVTRKSYT